MQVEVSAEASVGFGTAAAQVEGKGLAFEVAEAVAKGVLEREVAANALEIDVVACWLEAVAAGLGSLVASMIFGCPACMLAAFAGDSDLVVGMEVGTKLDLVLVVLVAVASALAGCRKGDWACRHSWAVGDLLEGPGWSWFDVCAAARDAERFETRGATCLAVAATVRAGTAAFAHCALEVNQKVCLAERVGNLGGVPFGGASWGGQALVCLAPLRQCLRPLLHRRLHRLRHACLQSPGGPCVRAHHHTISH